MIAILTEIISGYYGMALYKIGSWDQFVFSRTSDLLIVESSLYSNWLLGDIFSLAKEKLT